MSPRASSPASESNDVASKSQIRQSNEALIVAVAEHVFAGAGFAGATMAAIATAAGLPKANVHYYFGSKQALYHAVLERTLKDWLVPTHAITPQADPRQAIESYIRAKMALALQRPDASKVFANELLHGAPVLKTLLANELRELVLGKVAVIDGWIAAKRMAPVDGVHLFFTIWAATQTYADFDVQVCAVLGHSCLSRTDQTRATEHVVSLILRGCGF